MKNINLELDFHPRRLWPEALPIFSWKTWIICGFERFYSDNTSTETHFNKDLPQIISLNKNFEKSFVSCHENLSLSELARVFIKINSKKELKDEVNWNIFFTSYNLHFNENLEITLKILASLPKEFQNWVSEKCLSQGDLAILRSLIPSDLVPHLNNPVESAASINSDTEVLCEICKRLSSLNPTRSQGVKILKLACELALTDKISLKDKFSSAQEWENSLTKQRYPQTSSRDKDQQDKVRKLPWPKHTKVQWKRSGDTSGLEISFTVESQRDFRSKIEGLIQVETRAEKKDISLWK